LRACTTGPGAGETLHRLSRDVGFTLIEIVIAIVLVGVLVKYPI
jgi:prepilin-type N-terminal cleavage/methylation domain-containing protein